MSKEFQLALDEAFAEGYASRGQAIVEQLIDYGDDSLSKLISVSKLPEDKVREIARRKGVELI